MTTWRIHVLGPFVVKKGGEPLSDKLWRSRQTRTILKVLLTRRGQVVPVDQLIDILWPDANEKEGRRSLHVRISQLRRALQDNGDDPCIFSVDGGYMFRQTADCTLDVAEFEEKVRQGGQHLEDGQIDAAIVCYEQARVLYQGDFLAGDLYETWSIGERERQRELHMTALTELAECYAQQGKYRRAMQLCREVLAADPVREAVYVRLILYHYYAGERDQALQVFARGQKMLDEELDVSPLPETAILIDKIRAGTLRVNDSAAYPLPIYNGRLFDVPYSLGSPPLVGREREYMWLVDRWRDPKTTLLLVAGEAGVGKSYLISQFCRYLQMQQVDCFILAGRSESGPPYGTLYTFITARPEWLASGIDAETRAVLLPLFPVLTEDATHLPALPSLTPDQESTRLRTALLRLLQTCLRPGTLLVIDDAQWIDPASLGVLLAWGKQESAVFVYRSDEVTEDHFLWRQTRPFVSAGRAAQLIVRPLSAEAVADLVNRLAGQPLPDIAAQLARQSGGSPLFVIAALQHLFEQGNLFTTPDGTWQISGETTLSLPPSLRKIVSARLSHLTHTQQKVIDILAVAGGSADFALLARVIQMGSDALFSVVDDMLTSGLLVEPRQTGDAELALAYSYYRDVILEVLPPYRRRHIHGQMAVALVSLSEDVDAEAPLIANHYLKAEQPQEAATWFVRAGDAALAQFALNDAKMHFQQALDLIEGSSAMIWQKVGWIAHQQACYDESSAAYAEAFRGYQESEAHEDALRVRLYQAESLREASRFEEAVGYAEGALAETAVLQQNPALHAKAYITLSNVYRSGQLAPVDIIRDHLRQGLTLAEMSEAVQLVGEAHFWLGVLAINRGATGEALKHDEAALAAFESLNYAGWLTITYNNLAYHALLAGRPQQALSWARKGLALAEKVEARHATGWLLSTLGEIQTHLGLLAEAVQTLTQGLAMVIEFGPPRLQPGFLVNLAVVKLAEGDLAQAMANLQEALLLARDTAPQFVPRVQVLLAEVCLGLNDLQAAQQFVEAALAGASSKKQQRTLGQGWRVQARITLETGAFGEADDCFASSHGILLANGDALEQARTEMFWGRMLAVNGEAERGAALLAAAEETFATCESVLDLQALLVSKQW